MKDETSRRWMVVDNNSETLEAVRALLEALTKAEVCAYRSATEALEAFVAAPESFGLVITDFEMPGMNGVDFRRHLQALWPALKILLITGSGQFTEQSALQSGFCGLLRKPFSLGALKAAVERAKDSSTHRTELAATI